MSKNNYGYTQLFSVLKGMKKYTLLLLIGLITLFGVSVFEVYFPNFMREIINDHIGGKIETINGESRSVYLVKNNIQQTLFEKYNITIIEKDGNKFVDFKKLKDIPLEKRKEIRAFDINGIISKIKIIVILLILYIIIYFIHFVSINYIAQSIMYDLRKKVFSHLLRFKMSYFIKVPAGVLVTRVINDVEAINKFFSGVMITWLKDIVLFIGIAYMMFTINSGLSIVLFFIIPVLFALIIFYQRKLRDSYRNIRKKIASLNSFLSENISGIFVIKAFNREKKGYEDFNEINEDVYCAYKRQMFIRATFAPFINITRYFSISVIIVYGGHLIIDGKMLFGDMVAFLTYAEMFFRPVRDIVEKFDLLQSAQTGLERVYTVLNNKEELEYESGNKHLEFKDKVEFRDVYFEYKKAVPVLKNLSFEVKKGEKVAFVGHTGAGKTTIINLLTRFYRKQKGNILIDGIDIEDYTAHTIREKIAYVPQDVFIFSEDISYNIGFNDIDEKKMNKIIKELDLKEFLDSQKNDLKTKMLERGESLSYGERQLIAFCRALYSDPEIIILDEATSNIDSNTESIIQNALEKLLKGRTAFIVAHRLSTVKNCDKIFVLKDGRIVEYGDHDSLMGLNGHYKKLYELQYE